MNLSFLSHEVWSLGLQARMYWGLRALMRKDDPVLGRGVETFEKTLAKHVGTKYAAAVGSGSDAIYLALRALDVQVGDEIIVPANVCVAVVESILRTGASVHFADINRETYTIDPRAVERAISANTRAVLCVHTYGLPANMGELTAIAEVNRLRVIELCGQAFGATLHGDPVGTFGDVACFSFNPSKILGGIGDGGAVLSNNQEITERVRRLANHGRAYVGADAEYVGLSSRLDTFNAVVLTHRLQRVGKELRRRRIIAQYYRALLQEDFRLQVEPMGYESSVQFFVVESPMRDQIRQALKSQGIRTKVHYALPYKMPAYQGCSLLKGTKSLPVTEEIAECIITLPFHNQFRKRDANYVAKCLLAAYGKLGKQIKVCESKL